MDIPVPFPYFTFYFTKAASVEIGRLWKRRKNSVTGDLQHACWSNTIFDKLSKTTKSLETEGK
jgi:hypothetical protein